MNEGGDSPDNIKYGRNGGRKVNEMVYRRAELVSHQNSIFTNIQQIKDIYLQDTEKVSKVKMESPVIEFANSSDALGMSPTLSTLVTDESLLNLHPSESIGGLSRRLNCVQNLDESSSSTCDISELNATITPVHLVEESEGMILVAPSNMKDQFCVPKPIFKDSPLLPKDNKDCISNVIASNRILDKIMHKSDQNFITPLRVSELCKTSPVEMKPIFNSVKIPDPIIYEKLNSGSNCASSSLLIDVSRHDLSSIESMKESLIVGNSATIIPTMQNEDNQYCLPINAQMQCSQGNAVIAQASTKDVFLNANCIVSPSQSRNTMLSVAEHNTKRITDKGYLVDNKRTEPLLLHTDTLYATQAPNNDTSQSLNFITDANMLSQINEMSEGAKNRSFRHVDILLSQLQPNDEGVINLGPISNSLTGDLSQHNGTNSADHLNVSMSIEPNNLADLSPSPLLNTISPDFLDNNSVISKTLPGHQTFLPNLSTTADLALSFSTHFLENSNMSIDMGSLSEGEGSLNVSHGFVESLEPNGIKKPSVQLNFMNALKDVDEKYDSGKLTTLAENLDAQQDKNDVDIKNIQSVIRCDNKRRKVSPVKVRSITEAQRQKELLLKTEDKPVVQQVQCLKCSVCSFLSLDEAEMTIHMKNKHSNEEKKISIFNKPVDQLKKEPVMIKEKRPVKPSRSKTNLVDCNTTDVEGSDVSESELRDETYLPQDDDTNESNSTNEDAVAVKREIPSYRPMDDEATYRCGVNGCTHRMKLKSNIEYHRMCHSNAFLLCQECTKKFSHWSTLAMHLWKEHFIDMELYSCELCNYKSYSFTKLVNNHLSTHSNERPFLCDVCGKDFKTAKQLRSHKTLHQEKKDELMLKCEKCNRKFSEKRMLLSHMEAVHNKLKPYLCNFCGKSFASKSTLILHIRKHTGEKPFSCDTCTYSTSDHNSMRRHKMKHSNVKRYSCPYCDYSSIQSSTFKVHLKRKHDAQAQKDGLIFTCKQCTFKTVKSDNYLAHIAIHHKTTVSSPADKDKSKMKETPVKLIEKSPSKKRKRQTKTIKIEESPSTNSPDGETTPTTQNQNQCQQAYYVVQMPHVVNINWETTEAVELSRGIILPPQNISGQMVQLGSVDDYDSTMLQQVEVNNGYVQLTPEVVAVPISNNFTTTTTTSSTIPNILYLSAETDEGPISPDIDE